MGSGCTTYSLTIWFCETRDGCCIMRVYVAAIVNLYTDLSSRWLIYVVARGLVVYTFVCDG